MRHFASSSFWESYNKLPIQIKKLADKNFDLLKKNPQHPSLHLKKVSIYWSVRIGMKHRALAVEMKVVCYGFGLVLTPNMINC